MVTEDEKHKKIELMRMWTDIYIAILKEHGGQSYKQLDNARLEAKSIFMEMKDYVYEDYAIGVYGMRRMRSQV